VTGASGEPSERNETLELPCHPATGRRWLCPIGTVVEGAAAAPRRRTTPRGVKLLTNVLYIQVVACTGPPPPASRLQQS